MLSFLVPQIISFFKEGFCSLTSVLGIMITSGISLAYYTFFFLIFPPLSRTCLLGKWKEEELILFL